MGGDWAFLKMAGSSESSTLLNTKYAAAKVCFLWPLRSGGRLFKFKVLEPTLQVESVWVIAMAKTEIEHKVESVSRRLHAVERGAVHSMSGTLVFKRLRCFLS